VNENDLKNIELQIKLKQLEEEYRLARSGLKIGSITALVAIVAVIFSFSPLTGKGGVLTGVHYVLIALIVAGGIIVYFSFVFRRVAKVRMEISKTKTLIEMGSENNTE